jgi:aryl-alcohol dehydrogenase (NADP+)
LIRTGQGSRPPSTSGSCADPSGCHKSFPANIEETLSALSDLIRSGKVRAIGASQTPASGIVEAQWAAGRRGLERFRAEQPAYSMLSRGIEREVLPIAQRYGMGVLVWGPLAQGMLTGRVRKGQPTDLRRAGLFQAFSDERRLDAVEQIIPLAEILDRIDEIVPPGTDAGPLDQAYLPPALLNPRLRRRPISERTAA